MKIRVISQGTTTIDADELWQELPVRSALRQLANEEAADDHVASAIVDCTDSDRSDISHDEYATVTEDDGTELWSGWLDGVDRPAPDAERDKLRKVLGEAAHRYLVEVPPKLPRIVCLCGSTRFYDEFQTANYELTMQGAIVLSVGFYPHSKAEHGHGEGVGHDSAEKVALDELHKRKIDLADEVLVVSRDGYFGQSTAGEIAYAVAHGKPVRFAEDAAGQRAADAGLLGDAAPASL